MLCYRRVLHPGTFLSFKCSETQLVVQTSTRARYTMTSWDHNMRSVEFAPTAIYASVFALKQKSHIIVDRRNPRTCTFLGWLVHVRAAWLPAQHEPLPLEIRRRPARNVTTAVRSQVRSLLLSHAHERSAHFHDLYQRSTMPAALEKVLHPERISLAWIWFTSQYHMVCILCS